MRTFYRLLYLAIGLLAVLPLGAQTTVAVTGHVGDPSGAATSNTFIRFQLQGCGNNQPRVFGQFGLIQTYKDFIPDPSTGVVSGAIYPNDVINCGGVTGGTRWLVSFNVNNVSLPTTLCYNVLSSTNPFNLDSQTPCSYASPPPPPSGPIDGAYNNLNVLGNLSVYGLLSGVNAIFTGDVNANTMHTHHLFADLITLPAGVDCPSGQLMNGYGANLEVHCTTQAAAPVLHVFGRQGDVTAQNGDYNCSQITGAICNFPDVFYQTVQGGFTVFPQRHKLRFLNGTQTTANCSDNPGGDETDCQFDWVPPSSGTEYDFSFTTCTIAQTGNFYSCNNTYFGSPFPLPSSNYSIQCQPAIPKIAGSITINLPVGGTTLPTANLPYTWVQIMGNGTSGSAIGALISCHIKML